MKMKCCPFCEIINNDKTLRIIDQNDFSFVVRDVFTASKGHALIIPKRHVGSLF
jgi:diadenosine tetraphosphate (Ap4A) HIT family hydrolase